MVYVLISYILFPWYMFFPMYCFSFDILWYEKRTVNWEIKQMRSSKYIQISLAHVYDEEQKGYKEKKKK